MQSPHDTVTTLCYWMLRFQWPGAARQRLIQNLPRRGGATPRAASEAALIRVLILIFLSELSLNVALREDIRNVDISAIRRGYKIAESCADLREQRNFNTK